MTKDLGYKRGHNVVTMAGSRRKKTSAIAGKKEEISNMHCCCLSGSAGAAKITQDESL